VSFDVRQLITVKLLKALHKLGMEHYKNECLKRWIVDCDKIIRGYETRYQEIICFNDVMDYWDSAQGHTVIELADKRTIWIVDKYSGLYEELYRKLPEKSVDSD
jgi:hypothetical protein